MSACRRCVCACFAGGARTRHVGVVRKGMAHPVVDELVLARRLARAVGEEVRPLHARKLRLEVAAVARVAHAFADGVALQDGADFEAAVGAARVCARAHRCTQRVVCVVEWWRQAMRDAMCVTCARPAVLPAHRC